MSRFVESRFLSRLVLLVALALIPGCFSNTGFTPAGHLGGESSAEPVMGVREMVAVHCSPTTVAVGVLNSGCGYDRYAYTEGKNYFVATDPRAVDPASGLSGIQVHAMGWVSLGGRTFLELEGQSAPFEGVQSASKPITGPGNVGGAYTKLFCVDSNSTGAALAYHNADSSYTVVLRPPSGAEITIDQVPFTESNGVWQFLVPADASHGAFTLYYNGQSCGAQGSLQFTGTAAFITPD